MEMTELSSMYSVAASPLSAPTFAGYIFEDVPSRLPECIEFYLIQSVCLLGYFKSWPAVQAVYQSVTSSVSLSVSPTLSLCLSVCLSAGSSFSQLAIRSSMYFLPFCAAAQNFRFNAL